MVKAASKKTSGSRVRKKESTVTKAAAKKKASKKKVSASSPSAKQKGSTNSVASKTTAKKKAAAKATATKKTVTKKTAAKKTAAKKVAAKKTASKKVAAKKEPAVKPEAAAKKTASKATAKKTVAKKEPAAKKVAAKKVAAKKETKVASKKDEAAQETAEKKTKKKTAAKAAPSIAVGEPIATTVVPYEREKNSHYMDKDQLVYFSQKLAEWKQQLMEEVDRTVGHMKDDATNFPDPNDRATQEEEFSLELRTRDRERKLIKKINEAQKRIEENEYGYCETCGVEIGVGRLEARPTAELCIDCKTLEEIREKQIA